MELEDTIIEEENGVLNVQTVKSSARESFIKHVEEPIAHDSK